MTFVFLPVTSIKPELVYSLFTRSLHRFMPTRTLFTSQSVTTEQSLTPPPPPPHLHQQLQVRDLGDSERALNASSAQQSRGRRDRTGTDNPISSPPAARCLGSSLWGMTSLWGRLRPGRHSEYRRPARPGSVRGNLSCVAGGEESVGGGGSRRVTADRCMRSATVAPAALGSVVEWVSLLWLRVLRVRLWVFKGFLFRTSLYTIIQLGIVFVMNFPKKKKKEEEENVLFEKSCPK